jgi:uncharacterized protein
MSKSNVEIMQNAYAAFSCGDAPAVFAIMDPAIVWYEAENFPYADRNPYVGPAAVGEGIFQRLATEWDGFAVNTAEFIDAGDAVLVLGRYTGTYKASNIALDAQFAHLWRLRDGKVVAFQQYTDTAQANRVVQG